jgi:DNA polymerase elongation subunit (family B)
LYPHLLIQYNISPETLVEPVNYTPPMMHVLAQGVSVDKLLEKKIRIKDCAMENATVTPNGQIFRTDIQGFLPRMMEELYEDRKKFKKLMLKYKQEYENESNPEKKNEINKLVARYNNLQLAKKLSLNSAYGVLGSQYFRFYDIRLALAVTQAGQLSIRWIESKLNGYLNNLLKTNEDYVIASDTDSIYLKLAPLVDSVFQKPNETSKVIAFMDKVCETKIQPFIDKSYQELAEYVNAYSQKMQMKREALANKGIWIAKKRYVLNVYNNEGVAYNEPDMKVMGLQMIQSSTPQAIRVKMSEVIKLIINTNESKVQQFVLDFRKDFRSFPPEEISFPRGVNGLKDYTDSTQIYKKGTPIHVKGALLYNKMLKDKDLTKVYPMIKEGEKLKFTYLKSPHPLKDSVISYPVRLPKEFGLHEYVDYELQFEKAFVEPIRSILDSIGWDIEKRNSLESFFS